MKHFNKTFWYVTVFSLAMGFLETAVVIYLRKLYYPGGFAFPLVSIPADVTRVELWREAATLVMLVALGLLAGRNPAERFGYFLYSFALWDMAYYLFLKVFLDWPSSLLSWDILFLLPVPWVGPVLAPLILCCLMIFFAVTVIYFTGQGLRVGLAIRERVLLLSGAGIVVGSFIQDYLRQHGRRLLATADTGSAFRADLRDYVPEQFAWPLFLAGVILIFWGCQAYLRRLKHRPQGQAG